MSEVRTGTMYVGSGSFGFEANTLQRLSADDVARQEQRGLIPRFFIETRGRQDGSFFDVEMVEILVPGDAKSGPVKIVDDGVKKRFSDAYKNWKAGLSQNIIEGTPLELLVGTGSVLYTFKAMNIHTVEALSGVTDGNLDTMGLGGREMRDRAKRFVESQKTVRQLQDEEDKDRRIVSLEKQIAELAAGMRAPEAAIIAHERTLQAPVDENRPPEGSRPVVGDRPPPRVRGSGKVGEP